MSVTQLESDSSVTQLEGDSSVTQLESEQCERYTVIRLEGPDGNGGRSQACQHVEQQSLERKHRVAQLSEGA